MLLVVTLLVVTLPVNCMVLYRARPSYTATIMRFPAHAGQGGQVTIGMQLINKEAVLGPPDKYYGRSSNKRHTASPWSYFCVAVAEIMKQSLDG